MKKTTLRKYARLIARVGANVRKGQPVIVYANVEQFEFAGMVVEELTVSLPGIDASTSMMSPCRNCLVV